MEARALRTLDAVGRPRAAKFLEVLRLPRMPIPGEEDRQAAALEEGDHLVDPRDDRIAVRHAKGPPGQKSFWTSTTKSAGLRPMVPFPPFRRFAKRLRLGPIARSPRRNPRGKRGREGVRRTTLILWHRDLGQGSRTRISRRT